MTVNMLLRRLLALTAVSLVVACTCIAVGLTAAGVAALWFVGVGCAALLAVGIWFD